MDNLLIENNTANYQAHVTITYNNSNLILNNSRFDNNFNQTIIDVKHSDITELTPDECQIIIQKCNANNNQVDDLYVYSGVFNFSIKDNNTNVLIEDSIFKNNKCSGP